MGRPPGSKNKERVWGDDLRLNIGCGAIRIPGEINIDRTGSDCDIDLESATLPFKDASVDYAHTEHCLEHITNLIPLMNEIWRVLKPGAELRVRVPVFPHIECYQDPTHVRVFTERTFNYWAKNDPLGVVGESYGIKLFSRMVQHKETAELVVRMWK